MTDKQLIREAFIAREASYAPYSKFHVGAALLTKKGDIYRGCNVEIAGQSSSNCAERTAFFKAISNEEKEFEAIVIVGGPEGTLQNEYDYCAPCGVCRQVMAEFCDLKEFRVILARTEEDYKVYSLEELLPLSFARKDITK
ncbi:cytidine deaminase [Irregularibacter muris]|uniref:Cytidine deaminase n=1 Tax=Irregularibacter muris TaxID=1796619 RepID=A0AAE3HFC3_9FIRM|nr:cytidine deaminase [Irregularibacter muris]MCR1899556.1 cytidine deaminase [Irregularibacter muris]